MIARCLSLLALLAITLPAFAQVPTPRQRPEPVNFSQYLSDADFQRFRRGLDAADDEEWDRVRDIRLELTDTSARNILLWRIALGDPRATFLELDLALSELDNWPRDSFIRSEAESKINDSGLTAPFIVNWFDVNGVQTGRGRVSYAEALIDVGRVAEGEQMLRDTWRGEFLPLSVQRDTYRAHGDFFTEEDHMARIDYLIWSNQRTAARRVLPLLSGTNHDLADARLRLAGRQSGVDRAVDRIPASMSNDPGLVFERARWRRRSGLRDTVLPLLLQLPDAHGDVNALELMWTERKLMILNLIRDQDFITAYDLARAHGLSSGADFADAEFMAGWLALIHLDRPDAALAHFTRLRGIILPQSAYPTINLPSASAAALRPEEALVHSVIRQETEFGQHAVSGAGARGMMQMMPATARSTARSIGEPYRFNWLTDDLDYNLTLGMHHLAEVVDEFDGSYVLALAAYNAGAHRARRWIEDYGDPRDPDVDPIDWVESIPFSETRNYVQRVLENLQVYRSRLNADAEVPLEIETDLQRGTGPVIILADDDGN